MQKNCQQSDISQDSQFNASNSDIQQDSSQLQSKEELGISPSPKLQSPDHYRIFDQQKLHLRLLCHIKNRPTFQCLKNAMDKYFSKQLITNCQQQQSNKIRGQISSQFLTGLQQIPSRSIIYLSIKKLKQNRFNMVARNINGECFAYFSRQRTCKKILKILKLLAQVQDLSMVAIVDQTTEAKLNKSQIEKISEFCRAFVYFCDSAEHFPIENHGIILRSKKNPQKEGVHIFRKSEKQLIAFSSNLSIQSDREMIYDLKKKMRKLEIEEMQLLEGARGQISQDQRNLALDFIIVNIWRTFDCQPSQVSGIINKFLMQQQANFNKKQLISLALQNQGNQDKDPDMHFPEKMSKCSLCLRCKKVGINKKISFKCQGCSVRRKKDIPLCPLCFGDFHQKPQFYYTRMGLGCRKKRKIFKSQNKELSVSGASNIQQVKGNAENKKQMRNDPQEQHLIIQHEQDMMKNFKIKKLGTLFDEMFDSVQKLVQAKNSQTAKLFLKVCIMKYGDKIRHMPATDLGHSNGLTRLIRLFGGSISRQDGQNDAEEKSKEQVISLNKIDNEIVKKQQDEYYQ